MVIDRIMIYGVDRLIGAACFALYLYNSDCTDAQKECAFPIIDF